MDKIDGFLSVGKNDRSEEKAEKEVKTVKRRLTRKVNGTKKTVSKKTEILKQDAETAEPVKDEKKKGRTKGNTQNRPKAVKAKPEKAVKKKENEGEEKAPAEKKAVRKKKQPSQPTEKKAEKKAEKVRELLCLAAGLGAFLLSIIRRQTEEASLWFTIVVCAVVAALIICFFVLWYRSYRR